MQRTAPHGAPSSFLLYPQQAANCARTPAISIVASSPMATPSKPWASRAPAAVPSPANIRQGLPAIGEVSLDGHGKLGFVIIGSQNVRIELHVQQSG